MDWNDYLEEVESCAKDAILEAYDYDPDQSWDSVYDDLFCDDSVTGNGSGSFTFSTVQAAENVAGVIWDDGFTEYCKDMGFDGVPTEQGPEAVDVIARCAALGQLAGALEDYWDELTEETDVTIQAKVAEELREFLDEFWKTIVTNDAEASRLHARWSAVFGWLDDVCSEAGY